MPGIERQTCMRCGWGWWPKKPGKPRVCPSCKSPYWDRERTLNIQKRKKK
jgi:predicted Zn-ribbon and HTH transcriptional regulator